VSKTTTVLEKVNKYFSPLYVNSVSILLFFSATTEILPAIFYKFFSRNIFPLKWNNFKELFVKLQLIPRVKL